MFIEIHYQELRKSGKDKRDFRSGFTHQMHFTTKNTEDTKIGTSFLSLFLSFVLFVSSVVNPFLF